MTSHDMMARANQINSGDNGTQLILFMCIVLFKKLKFESFLEQNKGIHKVDETFTDIHANLISTRKNMVSLANMDSTLLWVLLCAWRG